MLRPLLYVMALLGAICFFVAIQALVQGKLYSGWTVFHLVWPLVIWFALGRSLRSLAQKS
jgi:hypothetical protein